MPKKRAPRITSDPQTWPISLHIAYAIGHTDLDCYGDKRELSFVFAGATGALLHEVFDILCHGCYIMRGFRMDYEHLATWVYRNGHHFWHWRITPVGYNPEFLSLDNLRFLIEQRIRDRGHQVTYFNSYNLFLQKA